MTDAEIHFDQVISDYIVGDINWLLDNKTTALGSLVATLGAAIDCVGGYYVGFRHDNSLRRSCAFMEQFMGLTPAQAKLVYTCVRCGYVHEGIGKQSVRWCADYERLIPGTWIYGTHDGSVEVNLVELAHQVLKGIEVLRNKQNCIIHVPQTDPRDKASIAAILPGLVDFETLENAASTRLSKIRGSHSSEDINSAINSRP